MMLHSYPLLKLLSGRNIRPRQVRPSQVIWLLTTVFILSGCTSLPKQFPQESSYALADTGSTTIGQALSTRKTAQPGLSGFYLLDDGLDAFVARAILAERAEKSLDAQYYLYHADLIGRLFTGLLVNAADRGVRVRLLVDDMALDNGDSGATVLNAHPNIEVRIFNPFFRNAPRSAQFIARFGSVTRRMHNKSFTADNQITVVGGRNIGNEYFDADLDLVFGDLDVLAVGPVVEDISATFDLYWNHELAYQIDSLAPALHTEIQVDNLQKEVKRFSAAQSGSDYMVALQNSNLASTLREGRVDYDWGIGKVLYDNPDKILTARSRKDLHMVTQLDQYLSGINEDLIIFSPYFVPGKQGVAWLKALREKGIRVRILTNSLASTDVSIVHAGYARYRKSLLRAGVEIWEFDRKLTRKQRKRMKGSEGSSKASFHAKSFLIDGQRVFIGSLNIDPRSIVENTELGIMIESQELASDLETWLEQEVPDLAFRLELIPGSLGGDKILWHRLEEGNNHIYTKEPHAGFWRRLSVKFLQWLPIESQL
ncbi:MAG: phospholipase D family protein [Arenicellales bacterium]